MAKKSAKSAEKASVEKAIKGVTLKTKEAIVSLVEDSKLEESVKRSLGIKLQSNINALEQAELDAKENADTPVENINAAMKHKKFNLKEFKLNLHIARLL